MFQGHGTYSNVQSLLSVERELEPEIHLIGLLWVCVYIIENVFPSFNSFFLVFPGNINCAVHEPIICFHHGNRFSWMLYCVIL